MTPPATPELPPSSHPMHPAHPTRRAALRTLLGGSLGGFAPLLTGCGGSGGGDGTTLGGGTVQASSLAARSNNTNYPLQIYLPPKVSGTAAALPVVYLLDGDSRFAATVAALEGGAGRAAVVAIGNEALRNRDFVPPNTCTTGGGGQAAYLDFIRYELVPFIEANFSADPKRRVLLGHSHGGSFVLYALFAEAATGHSFGAYLPSDASIACMPATVYGWEAAYAAANAALPVRVHLSWGANLDNAAFVQQLQSRRYAGFSFAAQAYAGGHLGMIPAAFADALAFALA